jgi:hypothetical protein
MDNEMFARPVHPDCHVRHYEVWIRLHELKYATLPCTEDIATRVAMRCSLERQGYRKLYTMSRKALMNWSSANSMLVHYSFDSWSIELERRTYINEYRVWLLFPVMSSSLYIKEEAHDVRKG